MLQALIETDLMRDQFVAVEGVLNLQVEALSVRSQLAYHCAERSQDVIVVVRDQARQRLAFCVCDGVSGSYAGEYAAQFLAQRLAVLLLELDPAADDLTAHTAVVDALQRWAPEASASVMALPLPPATNTFIQEALDERRAKRGSETVFLAGSLICETQAELLYDLRVVAMGNVRGVITREGGAPIVLNAQGVDGNRWGTLHGPIGASHIERHTVALIRLRIATDGIEAIEELKRNAWSMPPICLMQQTIDLRATRETDDLAVLDIVCRDRVSSYSNTNTLTLACPGAAGGK